MAGTGKRNAAPNVDSTDTDSGQDTRYHAPALKKGLLILETLADHPRGLSLTEIAKQLEYSVSEIFRMVMILQQQGYIQLHDGEKYRLTLKLFDIAHRQQPVHSIVTTALPLMQELATTALQSCHLAVYYEGRSMIVAQVDSPERWTFSVKVGSIVDLIETASGNVMLAFSSPAQRDRMFAARAALPGHNAAEAKRLKGQLAKIQADACWTAKSQQTVGVINLARPVFNADKSVAGVLIVPFLESPNPSSIPALDNAKTMLIETALRISRLMGFQQGGAE